MLPAQIHIPRLLIAGVHSGVGKSSVTLALVAALKRRGLTVQTYKVGPDYLDPGHLAQVSGRPCYNLDSWMCSHAYLQQLFCETGGGADICLVEGVMGLFDGSSADALTGSSAEIAALLQIPVALVVNTHGMARSFAALVSGYENFCPEVKLGGVLANRCGSSSHVALLRQALAASQLPPLLGAIGRGALPELASRHLGLVSAAERQLDDDLIGQLAAAAEAAVDLDQLLLQARAAAALPWHPAEETGADTGAPLRLGVARDEAFQFYYPDFFNELRKRGCEPVFFSPLRDQFLPENLAGLYFGGGYPEVHAGALAANRALLPQIRDFCNGGRAVYAECGGLIYLTRGVRDQDGEYPFVGHLPVWTRMLEKRKTLGYVTANLTADSLFGAAGDALRGHEFHYSELESDPVDCDGWTSVYQLQQNRSGNLSSEGYQKGRVLASYAHLHLASQPQALDRFVEILKQEREV